MPFRPAGPVDLHFCCMCSSSSRARGRTKESNRHRTHWQPTEPMDCSGSGWLLSIAVLEIDGLAVASDACTRANGCGSEHPKREDLADRVCDRKHCGISSICT